LQAPSEERKINHYWSPSGPVVVSNSDQYYFASWPVLVRSPTSTGSFYPLTRAVGARIWGSLKACVTWIDLCIVGTCAR